MHSSTNGGSPAAPCEASVASKAKKAKKKDAVGEAHNAQLGKSHLESPTQIRQRLSEGEKVRRTKGLHMVGSINSPPALKDKTAPLPKDEIDKILAHLAEIRLLLFCRLLLAHTTILHNAIKANSIEDFLNDKEVTNADL